MTSPEQAVEQAVNSVTEQIRAEFEAGHNLARETWAGSESDHIARTAAFARQHIGDSVYNAGYVLGMESILTQRAALAAA